MMRLQLFFQQFKFFVSDYKALSGSKKMRMFYIWMNRASIGILFYRLDRAFYLLFGKGWTFFRILFYPIFILIDVYSNLEINYKADIGPSLSVLHPAMGVVISGHAKIGKRFTCVGGNIVGRKSNNKKVPFIIGDNVFVGANAVILGPCEIADNTVIGACTLINKDTQKGNVMVGIPAKNIQMKEGV